MSAEINAQTTPAPRGSPAKRLTALAAAIAGVSFLLFILTRVLFAEAFVGKPYDPHAVPFLMAGKPAPLFSMKRLDTGETVELKDFVGKPIVLNFWATWCGPCKLEHPTLEWAHRRYGKEVVMLGIVFEDTEEATKKFLRENGGSWTQLYDPKSTVAVDYAVSGVPETYFINRAGTILDKYAAPIDVRTMTERIEEILR